MKFICVVYANSQVMLMAKFMFQRQSVLNYYLIKMLKYTAQENVSRYYFTTEPIRQLSIVLTILVQNLKRYFVTKINKQRTVYDYSMPNILEKVLTIIISNNDYTYIIDWWEQNEFNC